MISFQFCFWTTMTLFTNSDSILPLMVHVLTLIGTLSLPLSSQDLDDLLYLHYALKVPLFPFSNDVLKKRVAWCSLMTSLVDNWFFFSISFDDFILIWIGSLSNLCQDLLQAEWPSRYNILFDLSTNDDTMTSMISVCVVLTQNRSCDSTEAFAWTMTKKSNHILIVVDSFLNSKNSIEENP